jgi:flagellar hook-associated protein 1 FlgK
MDVRVVETDHGQVNIFTTSGIQLVGTQAVHMTFDAQGTVTATSYWNADPDKRTVGTITLSSTTGNDIDLVANKTFRSGQFASYLEMRDQLLPEAQTQLDEIAAALARALSDYSIDGVAATVGAQTGFDVDVGSLLAGNTIHLT